MTNRLKGYSQDNRGIQLGFLATANGRARLNMNSSGARRWIIPVLLALAASAFGQSFNPLYPPSYINTNWRAYCTYNGYVVANCYVTIFTTYYANTNGHFHNSGRPSSSVSPSSGYTNSAGYVPFSMTTSAIGQAEAVFVCAYYCGSTDYGVGYGDIYWTNSSVFNLVGGNTTGHGDNNYNHWMMTDAAYDILYSCQDYLAAYGGTTCSMNDMALAYGNARLSVESSGSRVTHFTKLSSL